MTGGGGGEVGVGRTVAAVVTAAAFVALACYAWTTGLAMVVFDQWAVVRLAAGVEAGEFGYGELFRPHVSHWHVGAQAVSLALAPWTRMDPRGEIVAILCVAIVYVLMFQRVAVDLVRAAGVPRAEGVARALTAVLLLAPDQGLNWVWGWQLSVHLTLLGVAVVLVAATRERLGTGHVVAAACGAGLAVTSSSTAFLLGPLGVMMMVLHPARASGVVAVAVPAWCIGWVGAALAFWSGLGAGAVTGGADEVGVWKVSAFASRIVGSAIARQETSVVGIVPWVGLAAAAVAASRLLGRGNVRRVALPLVFLVGYAVGAALLTAVGRAGLGGDQARVFRYVAYSNLFWLAVLLPIVAVGFTQGSPARRPAWQRPAAVLAIALVLVCAVGKAGGSWAAVVRMREFSQRIDVAARHFGTRQPAEWDATRIAEVGNPDQPVRQSLLWLRAKGWAPFADAED